MRRTRKALLIARRYFKHATLDSIAMMQAIPIPAYRVKRASTKTKTEKQNANVVPRGAFRIWNRASIVHIVKVGTTPQPQEPPSAKVNAHAKQARMPPVCPFLWT